MCRSRIAVRAFPAAAALLLLALAGACAPAPTVRPAAAPAERVAALERQLARDSGDLATLRALGGAYRAARQYDAARAVLARALARRPNDADASFQLALVEEDAGRVAEARRLYEAFLRQPGGASPRLRAAVRGRLLLLQRRTAADAARSALAREAELSATPPDPAAVAVFPFLFQAADSTLRPLSRALAELLVTDLGQTSRLRPLERVQVQALLDELRLAEQGLVDPATAARSGRLLGAGRVVQGAIAGDTAALRLNAAVVGLGAGWDGRAAPVAVQDRLRRLLDLQKQLALGVYRALGIELTPAERERVERRPTENLQALLAYGLGLEAEERGEFAQAAAAYGRAAQLDGGFRLARQRRADATQAALAAATSTDALAARAEAERAEAAGEFAALDALLPGAGAHDVAAEALGAERPRATGAVLRVRIRPQP